jgi:hypothetical protein
MEIQVDPIQNTVKLVARGINGPLTWSEMEYSEGVKPAGVRMMQLWNGFSH